MWVMLQQQQHNGSIWEILIRFEDILIMADKLLDSTQLVSGIAIMLSFFAGYKYASKVNAQRDDESLAGTSKTAEGERVCVSIFK